MKHLKPAMLITENRKLVFSQKVCKAAKRSNLKVIISPPDFHTLSRIISGKIGTVILDQKELGRAADLFFKSIRMFHCTTPVLLVTSNVILLEKSIIYKFERKITLNHLSDILLRSLKFEKMMSEADVEYMKQVDGFRHLTGDALNQALEQLRKKVFNDRFFQETQKVLPPQNLFHLKPKKKNILRIKKEKLSPMPSRSDYTSVSLSCSKT